MKKLVVAVTCHQGIGSSIWLKSIVKKFLNEHHIPSEVIQSDLHSVLFGNVDLVIGMRYLEEQIHRTNQPYIVVDNILDEELYVKLMESPVIKQRLYKD